MIPLSRNENIQTLLSIYHDKVLPLMEDYRIRLVAAAAFVVISALFVLGVARCMRGKSAPKKSDGGIVFSSKQTASNTTSTKPTQVAADTDPKDSKLQSLEEENQKLKRELEEAKQVHSTIQSSDNKAAIESEMQSKINSLKTELLASQSSLQEKERKLKELEVAQTKFQQHAQQSLKTQREKLDGAYQVEIESLKTQIAAGQKPEDVKLLEQLRKLLNLGPEVKLDRKLKKGIFGKTIPAEAQKLFDHLHRSKELQRLANTKPEDFNSPKFEARAGIPESQQLITLIKSLQIDVKSLKDENDGLVKTNKILSDQNKNLIQKSEQKSMNVSQITQGDK